MRRSTAQHTASGTWDRTTKMGEMRGKPNKTQPPLPTFPAPNPGSREARKAGCKCPVLDNAHGQGYMGLGLFIVSEKCAMHWSKKAPSQ